jgi:hypothetical protein
MMRVYLDTEFNGFGGELISIALVSEQGHELYLIRKPNVGVKPIPWVQKHVLPVLNVEGHNAYVMSGTYDEDIQTGVCDFLFSLGRPEVWADWPEDHAHLCRLMVWPEGRWKNVVSSFVLVSTDGVDLGSKVPHNALSDARALRDYCERNR